MQSVMEHSFSQVPTVEIPRSSFNRSHGLKTTFDADWLVPILVDEIIPGDTFNVNCTHFARLGSPTIHPLMDNLYIETFFFFIPNRLLWDKWERFCGAQPDPSSSIDWTIPALGPSANTDLTAGVAGGFNEMCGYMGIPRLSSVNLNDFSALPFRAYNLCFNEWFRDQNLTDSREVSVDDGPDATSTDYKLLRRGKRHDYFTSALPWPQKGDAVELPLTGNAPVLGIYQDTGAVAAAPSGIWADTSGGSGPGANNRALKAITGADAGTNEIYADLAAVSSATINDLRLAFQTQRLLERDARSGTRYVETIQAHFGVTVPDFRLQRPEFLGGGSSTVSMREVPNTSATATQEQAELAAYGISSGSSGFTKSFVEHGILLGLANVRGDITYSQGAERYWFKRTRYDFYYPVLSQIGEQAIENREIYYQNTSADEEVFGYQERNAEYRYKPSRLTGEFAPYRPSTLASWHLSEEFGSLPTLGPVFINSQTGEPLDRALTVPAEPQIIADFFFDMKCARPMPLFGVPGNLDHF